jgi:hypothetical protein
MAILQNAEKLIRGPFRIDLAPLSRYVDINSLLKDFEERFMKKCLFVGVLGWGLSAAAQDAFVGDSATLTLDVGPHPRAVGVLRAIQLYPDRV